MVRPEDYGGEHARLTPSPATSPGPQDVRSALLAILEKAFAEQLPNAIAFNEEGDAPGAFYFEGRFELYPVIDALLSAFPAIVQSDAQPVGAGSGEAICWHIQERRNGKLTRGYVEWKRGHAQKRVAQPEQYEVTALYTTPPSLPDPICALDITRDKMQWNQRQAGDLTLSCDPASPVPEGATVQLAVDLDQ